MFPGHLYLSLPPLWQFPHYCSQEYISDKSPQSYPSVWHHWGCRWPGSTSHDWRLEAMGWHRLTSSEKSGTPLLATLLKLIYKLTWLCCVCVCLYVFAGCLEELPQAKGFPATIRSINQSNKHNHSELRNKKETRVGCQSMGGILSGRAPAA